MIARSGGIYRRRSAALFDENVRIEARQILGDQRPVFANTDPCRLVVDEPAANQRIAIAKLRQRVKRLHDGAFFPVRAFYCLYHFAIFNDRRGRRLA